MLDDPSKVSYEHLDMLIGRLNHCGFLIPQAHHFMGRIRAAKYSASKRQYTWLSLDVRLDLKLWLAFPASAGAGIDMNNLTFRHPTHVSRVDASEHGIGGYSLVTGQAWHFKLPVDLRLRALLPGTPGELHPLCLRSQNDWATTQLRHPHGHGQYHGGRLATLLELR